MKVITIMTPTQLDVEMDNEPSTRNVPPQDRGRKAWLFLCGVSVLEITTWGWSYCYGVFRDYFFEHDPFKQKSLVSVGGMLANGILQLSLPIVIYLLNRYPRYRRTTMWTGCLLCGLSLIAGAFMTNVAGLVLCLGALYGLGAGIIYGPAMHYLGHWFVERKSLAYGIICGVGAAGGAGLPPLYTFLLERYGSKVTLVGTGIVTMLVTATALCFVQPRTPEPRSRDVKPTQMSINDFRFLRQPIFFVLLASTVVQALGHFSASVYLPSIGRDMNLTTTEGALLISLLNLAQAVGQPAIGFLTDYRKSIWVPFVICTGGGGLAALVIWPFSRTFAALLGFALVYGCTAGGFAVLRPRFASTVLENDRAIAGSSSLDGEEIVSVEEQDRATGQATFIFGILTASRGVSVTASGFLTAALVHPESTDLEGYGLGERWRNVMILTGVTMLLSMLGVFGRFLVKKDDRLVSEKVIGVTTGDP